MKLFLISCFAKGWDKGLDVDGKKLSLGRHSRWCRMEIKKMENEKGVANTSA